VITRKILCLPRTISSTAGGLVTQTIEQRDNGPLAILFSERADSLASGGAILADIWVGKRIDGVDNPQPLPGTGQTWRPAAGLSRWAGGGWGISQFLQHFRPDREKFMTSSSWPIILTPKEDNNGRYRILFLDPFQFRS
jgi:hypothetical protein